MRFGSRHFQDPRGFWSSGVGVCGSIKLFPKHEDVHFRFEGFGVAEFPNGERKNEPSICSDAS